MVESGGNDPTRPLELVYRSEIGDFGAFVTEIDTGLILGGVEIGQWSIQSDLRIAGGTRGPYSHILDSQNQLFFCIDQSFDDTAHSPDSHCMIRSDPDGCCFSISWETLNGLPSSNKVVFLWTNQDRILGMGPAVLWDEDAQRLEGYMWNGSDSLPAEAIQSASRIQLDRFVPLPSIMTESESISLNYVAGISIKGLRGFAREMSLSLSKPSGSVGSGLTIVVGANNAGKSTFWEGLEALSRSQNSYNGVSFPQGVRNAASDQGVKVQLRKENGEEVILQSRSPYTSETFLTPSPAPGPSPVGAPDLNLIVVPSRRQFQATFHRNSNENPNWMSQEMVYSRISMRDQFTARLFALHENDTKKAEFNELMSEVLGERFDWAIDLAQGSMFFLKVLSSDGVSYSSEGLGDGVTSLLFVLCALYDSTPGTLVAIDEPELSLHPQLVRRLAVVMARYSQDRQIVIFTHSPLLVNWSHIANGARVARVYKKDGYSIVAQPSAETLASLAKLGNHRNWRNPHSLGVDANEALFLEDQIIVVEGQEDAALLPRAFKMLNLETNGVIFGWGAGGAENVEKIVTLLKELGFVRVAVLIDNDKPKVATSLSSKFPDYHIAMIPAADIRTKPGHYENGKDGIFDEHGKRINPELSDEMRDVLQGINAYLSPSDVSNT